MNAFYLFTLAQVPVSVAPWFLGLLGYFVYSNGLAHGLLWGLCVTVSILVHEFGHALVAKRYRLHPSVMLHGWGGLCSHDRAERDLHDVFILAAGPLAGLAFGALVYGAKEIVLGLDPALLAQFDSPLSLTFLYLLYINIAWSLVNLLPLWPLDGGQLFRLLMLKVMKSPARAERVTHFVSIAVGGVGIYWGLASESMFLAILAGALTYMNVTAIASTSASGPIRSKSKFALGLLADAEQSLAQGNPREAARLCHQIRADTKLSGAGLAKVWAILAVACEAQGHDEDAETYGQRAPAKLVVAMRAKLPSKNAPQ